MKVWLTLCFSKPVIKRAVRIFLIVGAILINHGNAILKGKIDLTRSPQMGFTVMVPYVASTVSSVSTLMSIQGGIARNEEAASRSA